MKHLLSLTFGFFILLTSAYAQKPEKQRSFAREVKPHSYYVTQAELWWKEVEKDKSSENNWYNYFRACRNAHGTANWKTDFVKESPYLKAGPDIVKLMQKHIPNSFMYNYLVYLDGGIGTDHGENILKAYEMNPDFEGIHSSVISYAASIQDTSLRKRINRDWYKKNEVSAGMLAYGYNVLMSLDSNAILFTQHDNDTYPIWMLQDVLKIRPDVTVVNIDFFLLKEFREKVFQTLGIKTMKLKVKSVDDYEINWEKVVTHILNNYEGKKPLYLGMTVFQTFYADFADKMTPSGLAFRFSKDKKPDLAAFNKNLYEHTFLLDYIRMPLQPDANQDNLDIQNMNYLNLLASLYEGYTAAHDNKRSTEVKILALHIAEKTQNEEWIKMTRAMFK